MSGGKPFDLFLNAFSRADVLSWDLSFSIFPPFNLSFQPSKVFFSIVPSEKSRTNEH